MRKPRSDSKLAYLPDDQREQLVEWLTAGVPLREVCKQLAAVHHVDTSIRALSEFWRDEIAAALVARRQRALIVADAVADEAAANPGRFDDATIDALKQKAFELAINPAASASDVKGLFGLVLKARDQQLDEDRLALERDKFKAATQSAVDKGLDALLGEIEGDPVAEALFEKLKAAVSVAVKGV